MKVYISGRITGIPYDEVEINFNLAENRLKEDGFEVVNPLNNGLSANHTWCEHMKADIKLLMEDASNEHKDETDYIASQEYICGCSNENDKLFCWEASTACSIQARESFKAGANFILSKWQEANRWRKFATDDLPKIGQQIVCRGSKGNCHLSNPISNDGIHWLAENFTEWKPIE